MSFQQQHPRYEILEILATGDFAVVYRARDRELGRDVAVKQIHQQFLYDPRQLERYWQEAQLLAVLQHPHIMTIYDIVRPRGWLILELMAGNLAPFAQGQPLDLDRLRGALAGALEALAFLHDNRVIHGDIKPSNLMIDRLGRVKLGDFGLARRASNEQGSLLKGTTKYMAPETVSAQFGPIGPASDLYSLGFAAYELLCGGQFDNLFPGLDAFGRDRQIAWMMWHAAPDRRLPEIDRVLEGVPPDLSSVIQKLVQKEQAHRYRSAHDALRDLRAGGAVAGGSGEDEEERRAAARRKRRLTFAALAVSMLLSIGMFFLPDKPTPPPAGPPPLPESIRGVVRLLLLDRNVVVLEEQDTAKPKEVAVGNGDRVFLNDKASLLRDLKEADQVVLNYLRDADGRPLLELYASRPRQDRGQIQAVHADEGWLTMSREGGDAAEPLDVAVPGNLKILFNGQPQWDGAAMTLDKLQPGDRVTADHYQGDKGRIATSLSVLRVIPESGVVRSLDLKKGTLTYSLGAEQTAAVRTLPLATGCEISLNGLRFVDNRLLTPGDLQPGDTIGLAHDTHVVRIDAQRIFGDAGVLEQIGYDARTLDVSLAKTGATRTFHVAPNCEILLSGERASLDDLRRGDRVDLTHESIDRQIPSVSRLVALRPVDPSKWLLVVGLQSYDDATLTTLNYSRRDAELFRKTLASRYAVQPEHSWLFVDESRVRLEQAVPQAIAQATAGRQLIVYWVGHAYQDETNAVYLAPRDFSLNQIALTGLSLRWLVDLLEACPIPEKLLILDLCHPGIGPDLVRQPSTSEMVRTVQGTKSAPGMKTVLVLSSCGQGERGADLKNVEQGLFAYQLSEAFAGRGDKNRDIYLEPTELFEYLKSSMANASLAGAARQTPELFIPDNTPPRLTDDAKAAIRQLAGVLVQSQIDVASARRQYDYAVSLAPKELEPRELFGLILLRARSYPDALQFFEAFKAQRPEVGLSWEANAWNRFEKLDYVGGVQELTALVGKLPKESQPPAEPNAAMKRVLPWVGTLREFAASAAAEERQPSAAAIAALDAAVAAHGPQAQQLVLNGRNVARTVMADFDRQITESADTATILKLRVERRQLRHYATFPFETIAREIVAGIDL